MRRFPSQVAIANLARAHFFRHVAWDSGRQLCRQRIRLPKPAVLQGLDQALLLKTAVQGLSSSDALARKFKFRERMEMGYLGELLLKKRALVFPLCLGDLQKTKRFTKAIMVLKFIAMFLFIVVAMKKTVAAWQLEGTAIFNRIPVWNSEYSTLVFGNSVFLFCQHHMLPSMTAPMRPQARIPHVIGAGFVLITAFSCLINFTALVAWTSETMDVCSAKAGGHFCTIQPMYNLNFAPLSWLDGLVGVYIVAYPAMSTANFPVQAITTRNTLSLLLGLEASDPAKPLAAQNLVLLLAVLLPPFAVALVTTDVQTMIQYVGGYAGLTIGFLFPMLLVMYGRGLLNAATSDSRPLKTCFANPLGYSAVLMFYLGAIALVTQKLFFTPPASH